jgi:hypothetical protein
MEETADRDAAPHLCPPVPVDQFFDDGLQRDAVQRISWMGHTHKRIGEDMDLIADDYRLTAYSI